MLTLAEAPQWARTHIRVDADGCWIWIGFITWDGYGQLNRRPNRGSRRAHRALYIAMVGPVDRSLVLDHLCRVRACVNPNHLEPVTQKENLARSPLSLDSGWRRTLTACKKGHPFDAENTYNRPDGGRECRICGNAAKRRHRERQRERLRFDQ